MNSERTEELLQVQKKMLVHTRITMAVNTLLSLVLLVVIVVAIHWISTEADHVESSLAAIDQMVEDAGTLIANTNTIVGDAGILIENTNTMVTENADNVEETIQKLNEVDIEGLNDAIGNLNAAIQPLAEFASLFQR